MRVRILSETCWVLLLQSVAFSIALCCSVVFCIVPSCPVLSYLGERHLQVLAGEEHMPPPERPYIEPPP